MNAVACIFLQSITTRHTRDLVKTVATLAALMPYFRALKLFVIIRIDKCTIFFKGYIFIECKITMWKSYVNIL
jgi:hypothetical protein